MACSMCVDPHSLADCSLDDASAVRLATVMLVNVSLTELDLRVRARAGESNELTLANGAVCVYVYVCGWGEQSNDAIGRSGARSLARASLRNDVWWVLRLQGTGLPMLALRGLDTSMEATAPILAARVRKAERAMNERALEEALAKVSPHAREPRSPPPSHCLCCLCSPLRLRACRRARILRSRRLRGAQRTRSRRCGGASARRRGHGGWRTRECRVRCDGNVSYARGAARDSDDAALSDLETNSDTVDMNVEEPDVHVKDSAGCDFARAFSRMRTSLQPFWRNPAYFGVDEGAHIIPGRHV